MSCIACGAALFAAGLDACLHAQLRLRWGGCRLLRLVWSGGVAARTLSLKGVHGWQT